MGVVRALRDSSGEGQGLASALIPSDPALVQSALDGQAWAHEALFRRHSRMAAGLSYRLLNGTGIDAEALVQDAFVAAFTRLDSLREAEAFGAWLGSIVVRMASKKIRRYRLRLRLGLARKEEFDVDTVISKSAPPDAAIELKQAYALVESLKPNERIAFLLRRVEGLTIVEVAQQMSVSLSTAKRRLKLGEERFERALSRHDFASNNTDLENEDRIPPSNAEVKP